MHTTVAGAARAAGILQSPRAFLAASTLLFAASAVATIVWSLSMPTMVGTPMPGGWTMSMAWTPTICGRTWPGTAVAFLGMWAVMMVAMMLPSLTPMLWRYRLSVTDSSNMRPDLLAALAGLAYFCVWTLVGAALFPLGAVLATLAIQHPELSRAVPFVTGAAVVFAGAIQFTDWKARCLAGCRQPSACEDAPSPATYAAAWRHGLRLGGHCGRCCGNLMVVLLVLGVMDLAAMALVTAAVTAERLTSSDDRVARAVGAIVVGVGLLIVQPLGRG